MDNDWFDEKNHGENSTPGEDKLKQFQGLFKAFDLLKNDFPKVNWIVEDIIPENAVVVLGGLPGAFKSFISLYLCCCVVSKNSFLGKRVNSDPIPPPILYIDLESNWSMIKERLELLQNGLNLMDIFFKVIFVWRPERMKIRERPDFELLKAVLQEVKPNIVIIDSFIGSFSGEENQSTDVRDYFARLKALTEKFNISFFVIHHERKGSRNRPTSMESLRGSIDIVASADITFSIEELERDTYLLSQTKTRVRDYMNSIRFRKLVQPIVERGFVDGMRITVVGEEPVAVFSAVDKAEAAIKLWVRGKTEFTTKEVLERFKGKRNEEDKYSESTINKALKKLAEEGAIENLYQGRWKAKNVE